jgi:hypothetical protein
MPTLSVLKTKRNKPRYFKWKFISFVASLPKKEWEPRKLGPSGKKWAPEPTSVA